jgi:hypothetical protein
MYPTSGNISTVMNDDIQKVLDAWEKHKFAPYKIKEIRNEEKIST